MGFARSRNLISARCRGDYALTPFTRRLGGTGALSSRLYFQETLLPTYYHVMGKRFMVKQFNTAEPGDNSIPERIDRNGTRNNSFGHATLNGMGRVSAFGAAPEELTGRTSANL